MARRIQRQSVAVCGAILAGFALAAVVALAAGPALTPSQQAVVQHISEDSLRGHLSFIASDSLEGRATPSRGLDLAAEYIAAQFRRAGLEPVSNAPAGDDGYFQTAKLANGTARNVAGILRGSDPALRDTYVILSAHYDHLGTRPDGADKIFNGANDDGSGTVSVIEIAAALAAAPERPKRSILFLAFYGEEEELMGSRYYAAHPLVPLKNTIAEVNLEQVGRTDASNGPQVGVAYLSGYDYSDLGPLLADAAKPVGFSIAKDDPKKGEFFDRSDNFSLARAGIPSHSIYVADDFPDYHRVGDEWQKIDYANMAKLDRAIALGLLHLASGISPPKWNEALPATRRFVEASRQLHP
jgi:hypothetical protein